MQIAVFGDIHGNIDALTAVLQTLNHIGVERMVCTGDIVGYGACPSECIEVLRELGIPAVRGNHDEYTSQTQRLDWRIRPEAREVIFWNRKALSTDQLSWLAALPFMIETDGFSVVHASHAYLPHWPYILNERAAIHNFLFQRAHLAFNGHSHVPVYITHRSGQRPKLDLLRNALLPRARRLIIGVGAVGQPRDGDPRACVVVYDSDVRSVRVLRVAYDVKAAQRRIRRAGFPDDLAERLALGQ